MSENSKIEWTDHTFNPWTGCTKVSPGCAHCYAEALSKRNTKTFGQWGSGKPRKRTSISNWNLPVKWNREDERRRVSALHSWPAGSPMPWHRPRVFCASLADWLDDEVPIDWLADLLDLIRLTPNLDWLMLSKRPQNWRDRIDAAAASVNMQNQDLAGWYSAWLDDKKPPANVWIGTTVEDGPRKERLIHLRDIPARVRFLSCEPLLADLGFIDLRNGIDWVIAGGESGPGCRPFDPDWARSLRDQCQADGVAFFMKQMGGTRKPFPEIPADLMVREFPQADQLQPRLIGAHEEESE